jgi:serine/threonine-protein kinase HipA
MQWCQPINGASSTHIIKPTATWPHSAQNEALVIGLGRACELTDSDAWVEQMGETDVAVGLRPTDKYQIGRPVNG